MKTTTFTLAALVLVTATFTSCKKKKETPAPVSIVKSFTFNTTANAWTLNNKAYSANYTLEAIDESILSSGSVNVFRGDGTGSSWTAMPVTLDNIQYSYDINLHTVKITVSEGLDASSLSNPGVQQFRVVVIKGEARKAHPSVNWNDYDQVKHIFQLSE